MNAEIIKGVLEKIVMQVEYNSLQSYDDVMREKILILL